MAHAPARLPSHLLPQSKASATSSSSTTSHNSFAGSSTQHTPRPAYRPRGTSPSITTDVSDKATASFIRRVLCPLSHTGNPEPRRIDELLPPLTSSNEVDLQLYAIVAIIVKDFVYSWYGKITPDKSFVEEVVRIFAHCFRDLEQRARRIDLEELVLDEIPELLTRHIQAYRAAYHPRHPPPVPAYPRQVYHTLVSHPAFSPVPTNPAKEEEQGQHEETYRQLLIQGVLAVLLPTDDLQNPCLRTLVGDVLADLILGKGVGGRACENWLIWDGVTKIVASIRAQIEPKVAREETKAVTRSRLEKFGLLSDKDGKTEKVERQSLSLRTTAATATTLFWRLGSYAYIAFVTARFILAGLIAASSAGPRNFQKRKTTGATTDDPTIHSPMVSNEQAPTRKQSRPILSYSIFGAISEALELDWRMPWVVGGMSLVQWHLIQLRVGATDGILDLFLHSLLQTYVFPASRLPSLLLTLRTSLFPNNTLGPAREVPSPEEALLLRRQAAESVVDLVPRVVAKRIFGRELAEGESPSLIDDTTREQDTNRQRGRKDTKPENKGSPKASENSDLEKEFLIRGVEDILDCFEDQCMNKHLIFGVVELVLLRLVPEIGEKTPQELLEDKGVFGMGFEDFHGESKE